MQLKRVDVNKRRAKTIKIRQFGIITCNKKNKLLKSVLTNYMNIFSNYKLIKKNYKGKV